MFESMTEVVIKQCLVQMAYCLAVESWITFIYARESTLKIRTIVKSLAVHDTILNTPAYQQTLFSL